MSDSMTVPTDPWAKFLAQQREDVAQLRRDIAELAPLTDEQVRTLYGQYSDAKSSASWLAVSPKGVEDFRRWATRSPLQAIVEEVVDGTL